MSKKILMLTFSLAVIMAGCSPNKKSKTESQAEKTKTLVLYYSQTGTTKQVAEELQRLLGADIDSIVAVKSYGTDYDATIERWKKEREDSAKVEIKPIQSNINDYDTIFLGFPIWGGSYASPISTFVSENLLEGKTVITFATFGSGGIEQATVDVRKALPDADVEEGYGVRNARISKAPEEIKKFIIEKGYIKGETESRKEFSEAKPVNPEETEIFNQACGNYQFPLGSPVTVAKRSYDGITEYRYDVKSKKNDGQETDAVIYVNVKPGETPEFTRVVRN